MASLRPFLKSDSEWEERRSAKLAILEQKTDADIALAIRYLDPEFAAKRTAEDTGTILGIWFTFLAFLAGALTYICFYVRTL